MKEALIGLLVGIVLLAAAFLMLPIYSGASSFDIHLRDTFFVIDHASATVFVLLILGTFFSIGGVIGTRLKRKLFAVLLVLCLATGSFYVVSFYRAFQNEEETSFPMNGR